MSYHLFQHLAQEEWKLVFALAFLESTDTWAGSYDLDRFSIDPPLSAPGHLAEDFWLSLFTRAIRFLALGHKFEFEGLRATENGEIVLTRPVQLENIIYVNNMRANRMPGNPQYALLTAIEVAGRRLPELDLAPMRAALRQIDEDLATVRANRNAQALHEEYKTREAALRTIGVRPVKEVVH